MLFGVGKTPVKSPGERRRFFRAGLTAFPGTYMKRSINIFGSLTYGFLALLFMSGSGLLCGCTVKEFRGECPAWVGIRAAGEIPEGIEGTMQFFVYRNGVQELANIYTVDQYRSGLDLSLTKGPVDIAGVVGWPGENISGDSLLIPVGDDCPDAWAFSDSFFIESEAEEIYLSETFRRLYANLHVELYLADETYPYTLLVEGDVDGYILPSLSCHHGKFLCYPKADEERKYDLFSCRVPRQDDVNLTLSLVRRTSGTKADVEPEEGLEYVYTLELGRMLQREGYLWSDIVPEDIDIVIDFASMKLRVSVNDWVKVVMMEQYVI